MNEPLLQKTLALLEETDRSKNQICAATGLKLRWLYDLQNGNIPEPGVNKIQTLHDYLSDRRDRDKPTAAGAGADGARITTNTLQADAAKTAGGEAA